MFRINTLNKYAFLLLETSHRNHIATSPSSQIPSLTKLPSHYLTPTPDPPKLSQQDQENSYLRKQLAELTYTNEALTNRFILLENSHLDY